MRKYLSFKFWAVRLLMFTWGFAVTYYFTGQIDIAGRVFVAQAVGNTIIMFWLL
jgi:uncharacterized membrane protein